METLNTATTYTKVTTVMAMLTTTAMVVNGHCYQNHSVTKLLFLMTWSPFRWFKLLQRTMCAL